MVGEFYRQHVRATNGVYRCPRPQGRDAAFVVRFSRRHGQPSRSVARVAASQRNMDLVVEVDLARV